jgi:uncharacterized protein YkwD
MNQKWRVTILGALAVLWAVVLGIHHGGITLAQGEAPLTPRNVTLAQAVQTIYLPLVAKPAASVPFADEVIVLVNQERASNGCPALVKNDALTNAAQGHSTDMALNDFFSHTGSDGSSPGTRATRVGYSWSLGENIAAGQSTPQHAVQDWMNSPGHRANILNCSFSDTGVGYYYRANDPGSVTYRHYWTQMFGRPR